MRQCGVFGAFLFTNLFRHLVSCTVGTFNGIPISVFGMSKRFWHLKSIKLSRHDCWCRFLAYLFLPTNFVKCYGIWNLGNSQGCPADARWNCFVLKLLLIPGDFRLPPGDQGMNLNSGGFFPLLGDIADMISISCLSVWLMCILGSVWVVYDCFSGV